MDRRTAIATSVSLMATVAVGTVAFAVSTEQLTAPEALVPRRPQMSRSARPGRAPVCSPSTATHTPFTHTRSMPAGTVVGSLNVPVSMIVVLVENTSSAYEWPVSPM